MADKGKAGKNVKDDKIAKDMGIGQLFSQMATHVDYMCPMTYPSHYAHGEFGIVNPNAEPYKIILKSVGDAKDLIGSVPTCKLRPWIQDFTLGPPHYGPPGSKSANQGAPRTRHPRVSAVERRLQVHGSGAGEKSAAESGDASSQE